MLATGGKSVHLWSLSATDPFSEIKLKKPVINDICFAPDGRTLYIGSDSENLNKVDIYTGDQTIMDTNSPSINRITCSRNGAYIATGSKTGTIALFGDGEKQNFRSHRVAITALAFTNDSKSLIAADSHGLISVGSFKRAKMKGWSSTKNGPVYDFTLSRHSETLAIACKSGIAIYDLSEDKIVSLDKIRATSLRRSPFKDNLLIGANKTELFFYDPRANCVIDSLKLDQDITSVDFKYDGVTVGAAASSVKIFDIRLLGKASDPVMTLQTDSAIKRIAFQPVFVDDPISARLIMKESSQPKIDRMPKPIPISDQVVEEEQRVTEPDANSASTVVKAGEEEEDDDIDLDKIRQELKAIEEDVIAHEPTMSPRNAALLKTARELRMQNEKIDVFSLTETGICETPRAKKTIPKVKETSETMEMAKIISDAYATAMEDMQDEMTEAMNNIHFDILRRVEELKRQIAELQ